MTDKPDKKPRTKRTAAWKLADIVRRRHRHADALAKLDKQEAEIIAAERAELAARAAALPKEQP